MSGERVLVVDDEDKIVQIVRAYLEKDGYRVSTAHDGAVALEIARKDAPDLIVLDLMLPGLPGLDVCREIRRQSSIPIIILTARDDDSDKIVGLELGADDYVTKPFNPKELVARVRAVLRRGKGEAPTYPPFHRGDLTIDVERHQVKRLADLVDLTPTEFGILAALAERPGRVFTRMQLLDAVQGEAFEGYERAIDSHVKNLRRKLERDPRHPSYVQTVFGVGYRFADSPD